MLFVEAHRLALFQAFKFPIQNAVPMEIELAPISRHDQAEVLFPRHRMDHANQGRIMMLYVVTFNLSGTLQLFIDRFESIMNCNVRILPRLPLMSVASDYDVMARDFDINADVK